MLKAMITGGCLYVMGVLFNNAYACTYAENTNIAFVEKTMPGDTLANNSQRYSKVNINDLSYEEAILTITGRSSIEEIDEESMQNLEVLRYKAVEINRMSRERLIASNLFSLYQVESLIDYRNSHGDILSFSELSLIDGFNPKLAAALRNFVSLKSPRGAAEGVTGEKRLRQRLALKMACRVADKGQLAYGLNYMGSVGESYSFNLSLGKALSSSIKKLPLSNFNFAYYGKTWMRAIVIGDFNARFGQALALWSSFKLDGFSSSSTFYMRAGGISPCVSYSNPNKYRGVAMVLKPCERVNVSAFISLKRKSDKGLVGENFFKRINIVPGLNISYYLKQSLWSCSSYIDLDKKEFVFSFDNRLTIKGVNIFTESMYCPSTKVFKGIYGLTYPVGGLVLSSNFRYFSEELYRWAVGMEWKGFTCTMDWKYKIAKERHSLKCLLDYNFKIKKRLSIFLRFKNIVVLNNNLVDERRSAMGLRGRLLLALRNTNEVDMALEVSRRLSMMSYVQWGKSYGAFKLHWRSSFYRIKEGESIYSYERDLPGSMSIKNYRGNGLTLFSMLTYGWTGRRENISTTGETSLKREGENGGVNVDYFKRRHLKMNLSLKVAYSLAARKRSAYNSSCELKLFYRLDF